MHGHIDTSTGANQENQRSSTTALIWDLPLRLFHWAMVGVVAIAAITGYVAPEWWLGIHVYAGYAIGFLLAFRLVWGVLGSHYSKFSTFPLKPRAALDHLFSVLKAKPKVYTGHNPVGAWVIVALLSLLTLVVLSGIVVLGGQENLGPLAAITGFKVGEFTAEIHETLSGLLIGLISIHLLGIFVEVKIFRHPILKAMISGKKSVPGDFPRKKQPGILRGAILFSLVVAALLFMGLKLNAQPLPGWRNIEVPALYNSECGDCHDPYHPSLETAASWRTVMTNLEDHFGEDASLDEETRRRIAAYLGANDAFSFDTEAANKIGRVEMASRRMTDTPYWKKRHRDIKDAVFKKRSVGSKVNCAGCHRDAATGRFDDASIHMPEGGLK